MLLRTSFGPTSTATEVAGGVDLSGKRALVTGGTSPAGLEIVRVLAACGAEVTLAAKESVRGAEAAAVVRRRTGNLLVHAAPLDLGDRRSIRRFLDDWWSPLDILVNHASLGVVSGPAWTDDGWELQFGTNFFGHFLLTVGLFDHLAAADQGARVVSVSSAGHLFSPVVFDDINFRYRPYDPVTAYGQSMTATVLLAVAVGNRWASVGVTANAVAGPVPHPPSRLLAPEGSPGHPAAVSDGAATTVLVAVSPLLDGISGRYFDDCNEAPPAVRRTGGLRGVAPYAVDPDNADRLWAHASRWL